MNIMKILLDYTTEPATTITYKQPFQINWFLVFMAFLLGALAVYFYKLIRDLRDMKQRCTIEVPAVITAVRKGYGHFGGRGPHYNADYQYEYEGETYKSHNTIYGSAKLGGPKAGETVMICINPFEPTELFDDLAETAMRFYSTSCILLVPLVGMMTFGQVIIYFVG